MVIRTGLYSVQAKTDNESSDYNYQKLFINY